MSPAAIAAIVSAANLAESSIQKSDEIGHLADNLSKLLDETDPSEGIPMREIPKEDSLVTSIEDLRKSNRSRRALIQG